jgi:MOSC domain-containing protein
VIDPLSGRRDAGPDRLDTVHISSLRIYPVKSTAGMAVHEAVVHPWGLDNDRRWMVVDAAGTTVTAREQRRLLRVTATPQWGGAIDLTAPGAETIHVAVPRRETSVPLSMSRLESGVPAGPAADQWLSEVLEQPVRLVWLDDPRRRTVGASHGGRPGDALNLADAGPILLTSTASLSQLDRWLRQTAAGRGEPTPEPLPMERFRPNLVVDDVLEAFAEDEWKVVRVGGVELRFAEHCDRCVMTTIDPATLAPSLEPTRTLARHRQWDHAVYFGIRLVPTSSGVVRVGDPVELG